MKSYSELKAEMETIQQQMVEAKKGERADALKKKLTIYTRSLVLQLACLKVRLL